MGTLMEQLKALSKLDDPFDISEAELRHLQIAAANEAFQEKRGLIPVLDKRAKDADIDTIRSLDDVVPLLFSHTNYKSYPMGFLTQKRWKQILQWLSMISTPSYEDVDLERVADIDDFLGRLWAKEYFVTTSSGTGGKVSLVPKSKSDLEFSREYTLHHRHLVAKIPPENQFHFFHFGPTKGTYTATYTATFNIEGYARADSVYILIEEPMLNSAVMKMAEMRKRIADSEAAPDEIAAFETEAVEQGKRLSDRFEWMIDRLLEKRHEKIWLSAMTAQYWDLMQRLKARGVTRFEMAPGSVRTGGGGRKHLKLPDDWQQQLNDFFGSTGPGGYGMSEMTWLYPGCSAGRYHIHPFAAALVLDQPGEKLQPREGVVEGRFAFMDPTTEYRWGGMISGDKVKVDFGHCPCGRKGATVLNPVNRYTDLTGVEDNIQCAGTIDAYIRGSFSETA